ncbi:MAG: OmpA family protein [Myxococcota bacterium]|nr:OmpA family protein [Myxococcota bacterium]
MRMTLPSVLVGLLVSSTALADGYSTDIELLQPGFSQDSIPGVDSPTMVDPNTWRTGMLTQYEQDPLVLYDSGYEIGAIIEDRWAVHLGMTYTLSRNAAVRVVVPTYVNSGTSTPAFGADGAGLGDVALGFRFQAVNVGPLVAGIRADIQAPTGQKDAYMGESSIRTGASLLAQLDFGRVDVLFDGGAVARSKVETNEDFILGSEMILNGGLRVEPVKDRVWVFGGALSRGGFTNFWRDEVAESPLEAIGGIQFVPIRQLQVDIGGGRGINHGYGTTQQRIFVGATWRWEEREKEPEIVTNVVAPPPDIPEISVEEVIQIEDEWKEGELARIVEEQIVIRDPIQFEFNTDRILPESIPTLRYVARLMNSNDRIDHVVIEGHASEEGTFIYNYDLSIKRARAVWEQLILAKVHPDRISYRGMGEVVPRDPTKMVGEVSESDLAENRRVDFHIVRQLGPLELAPDRNWAFKVPWSGDAAQAAEPPPNQNVNAGIPTENEGVVRPTDDGPEMDVNLFLEDDEEDAVEEPAEEIGFDDIGNDVAPDEEEAAPEDEDAEGAPEDGGEETAAPAEDSSNDASDTETEAPSQPAEGAEETGE